MPELDTQIREYIDATSEPFTAGDILGEAEQQPAGLAPSGRPPTPGWLVAGAAAIVVLLVGLVPLLLAGGEQDAATNTTDPVTTTQPATVPTTQPETATTTPTTPPTSTPSSLPDTTSPIEPSGVMDFTPIAQPNGEPLYKGVWFNDAFYALSEQGNIYKTSDGFTWVGAPLLSEVATTELPDSLLLDDLITDGEQLLVFVGETSSESVGGETCETSDHVLAVIVLDSQGSVTMSQPELPTPPTVACYSVNPRPVVGQKGILIAGSISSPPGSNPDEIAFGLLSNDGITWTNLDRTGPFASAQVEPLKADASGFYAGTTGPDGDGPVYYSPDGTTWSPVGDVNIDDTVFWRGQLVMEDDLIPDDMARRPGRLFVGPLGIIGTGGGGMGNDIPVDVPISFSVNGIDWQTWSPPEFETLDPWMQVIGIGDRFVVFQDLQAGQLWIGTPSR